MAVPGRWFPAARPQTWGAADIKLADGSGRVVDGELVITDADASNTILLTVTTDFPSGEYPGVEWRVQGLPDNADVRTLWRSDVTARRTNLAPMVVDYGQLRPLLLKKDPNWNGHIQGLALAIRLPPGTTLATPLRVKSVTALTLSAFSVTKARIGEWFTFEGFNGTTINTLTGGADTQDLPLPLVAATVVALAALLLAAVHRYAPARYGVGNGVTIPTLFVAAWLCVDARWAWNLLQQTRVTVARYGGKTVEQRHLAAEDGELYAFVQQARAVMPAAPSRVFVAAGEHYFRGRAAYHLYPNNVQFEAFRDTLLPAADMHAGDWIFVFHRAGMHYDPALDTLSWDGGPAVKADLKLSGPDGAALFQLQ